MKKVMNRKFISILTSLCLLFNLIFNFTVYIHAAETTVTDNGESTVTTQTETTVKTVTEEIYGVDFQNTMLSAPVLNPVPSITNQIQIKVQGTAPVGSTVVFTSNLVSEAPKDAGSVQVTDPTGNFEWYINFLQDGVYTVTAKTVMDGAESLPTGFQIEVDKTAPNAPSNMQWRLLSYNSIMLNWNPPKTADGMMDIIDHYKIYRNSELIGQASAGAGYYMDMGLQEATSYYYHIIAVDRAGNETPFTKEAKLSAGTFYQNAIIADSNIQGTHSNGQTYDARVSANGNKVAFISNATDHIADPLPQAGAYHLYVRDLETQTISLVGKAQIIYNYSGSRLDLNADGSVITYVSDEQELPLDTNNFADIYIYDGTKQAIEIIPPGIGHSHSPSISDDGKYVTFEREDGNGGTEVYLYDLEGKTLELIGKGSQPTISANGTKIIFGMNDALNGLPGLYVYDLLDKQIQRVELANPELSDFSVIETSIDADGQTAAFTALRSGDTQTVYVYSFGDPQAEVIFDMHSEEFVKLLNPRLTSDGQFVMFAYENNATTTGFSGKANQGVMIYDRIAKTLNPIGNEALKTTNPSISNTGKAFSFISGITSSPSTDKRTVYLVCSEKCGGDIPLPPPIPIERVEYTVSSMIDGQIARGGSINVIAAGEQGKQLQAKIKYMNHGVQPAEGEQIIILNESGTSPGIYSGNFPIPLEASEILSIRVERTDDSAIFKDLGYLPRKIAGQVKMTLVTNYPELLSGIKLLAWSNSNGKGTQIQTNGDSSYVLNLADGNDYEIKAVTSSGKILNTISNIVVKNGEETISSMELKAPASLFINVKDPDLRAVTGARVLVTKGGIATEYITDSYGLLNVPGDLFAGDIFEVQVIPDKPLLPSEIGQIVLKPAENAMRFNLVIDEKGTVTGKVTDEQGQPVADAKVTISNAFNTVSDITDQDGNYEIETIADDYTIDVTTDTTPSYGLKYSPFIRIPKGQPVTKDLTVSTVAAGNIILQIETKRLDENWKSITLNDYFSSQFYQLRVTSDNQNFKFSEHIVDNELFIQGTEGDLVTICLDGRLFGMTGQCQQTTLNKKREGVVQFQLEEKIRVTGKLESMTNFGLSRFVIYEMNDAGFKGNFRSFVPQSNGDFDVSLIKPGRYTLELQYNPPIIVGDGGGSGSVIFTRTPQFFIKEFSVSEGQIVDLGIVSIPSYHTTFAGKPGNQLDSLTEEVQPGGTISLRGTYRKEKYTSTVEDVKLLIEVPMGTTLIENSVVLNNEPVIPIKISDSLYTVSVGNVSPDTEGFIRYQLKVSEQVTMDVDSSLQIEYKYQGATEVNKEKLGTARTKLAILSLNTPEIMTSLDTYIHGRAPIGSTVQLYVDGDLQQSFEVSPAGIWGGMVHFNAKEQSVIWQDNPVYLLEARVISDSGIQATDMRYLMFDKNYPGITKIDISQLSGKTVTIDTTKGIGRFVYSVDPKVPVNFKVSFKNPDRVKNVKVYVGTTELDTVYNSSDKTFMAAVDPGISPLSNKGLYVTYDVYSSDPYQAKNPTVEEWEMAKQQLPEFFQQMTVELADPLEVQAFAGNLSTLAAGDGTEYSPYLKVIWGDPKEDFYYVRMFAKRLTNYVPPNGERSNSFYDIDLIDDGQARKVTFSFVTHESALLSYQPGGIKQKGAFEYIMAGNELIYSVPDSLGKAHPLAKPINWFNKAWGFKDLPMDFLDWKMFMMDMQDFYDQVSAECHGPTRDDFIDRIDKGLEKAWKAYAIKNVLTLTGLAYAFLPGMGQIAGFSTGVITTAAGDAAKDSWDSVLPKLKKDFAEAQKWRNDMASKGVLPRCEDFDPETYWRDNPPIIPNDTLPDLPPVGVPAWIYDPSGYVYEGITSNRLENVKATIFYKEAGVWKEWNAEWYGQKNPLYTDELGKYAWDVPEGLWQVTYEKDGYLIARSPELEVLPPHFDVNIPMVSMEAPEVTSVHGTDEQGITISFSKPMNVADFNMESVTVLNSKQEKIEGTFEPVESEADANGRVLANQIRFIPSTPLTDGDTVRLTISKLLHSYAGVPLDKDFIADLVIQSFNRPVPEAVSGLKVMEGYHSLFFEWMEKDNPDFKSVNVYWKESDDSSYQGPIQVNKGEKFLSLTTLQNGKEYDIRITSVNQDGRESAGVTSTVQTLANDEFVADTQAPGEVQGAAVTKEDKTLVVTWEDPTDIDLHHIILSWREKGRNTSTQTVYIDKGIQRYVLSDLKMASIYEVKIESWDEHQNVSDGVLLEGSLSHRPQNPPPGNGNGNGNGGGRDDSPIPTEPSETTIQIGDQIKYDVFDGNLSFRMEPGTYETGSLITLIQSKVEEIPDSMQAKSNKYHLQESNGTTPSKPVTLTIRFNSEGTDNLDLRKLGIYRQDDDQNLWVYVGGVVVKNRNEIFTRVNDLGTYAVFYHDDTREDLQNHWSKEEVEILLSRHIMKGFNENEFRPDQFLTRAEAVSILMNVLPDDGEGPADKFENPFQDISAHTWYHDVVLQAAELGITKGYQDGTFRPGQWVSKEEFSIMATRVVSYLLNEEDSNEKGKLNLEEAINYLEEKSDTKQKVKDHATRSEAATLILYYLKENGFIEREL